MWGEDCPKERLRWREVHFIDLVAREREPVSRGVNQSLNTLKGAPDEKE
jgi:hypothetical protein